MTENKQTLIKNMLTLAKDMGASEAEVTLSHGAGTDIENRKLMLDKLSHFDSMEAHLTVYVNQCKSSVSFNDFSPNSIRSNVQHSIETAQLLKPDPYAGLASAETMAQNFNPLHLHYPQSIDLPVLLASIEAAEKKALAFDSRIKMVESINFGYSNEHTCYGNTHQFMGEHQQTHYHHTLSVISEDSANKTGMKSAYEWDVSTRLETLTSPEVLADKACEQAILMLNEKSIPTGSFPVLFSPNIAPSLIKAFLTSITGSLIYKKASFMENRLKTLVFPQDISIAEAPFLEGYMGSQHFDSEGVQCQPKSIVANGLLHTFLMGHYSAQKLGEKTTGNAGGYTNILVSHHETSFEQMIKGLDQCFLVTELMGQGVDYPTGDYSKAAKGFWIKDGKIEHAVAQATIAGNLSDMLQSIKTISNDAQRRFSIQTGAILIEPMTIAQ